MARQKSKIFKRTRKSRCISLNNYGGDVCTEGISAKGDIREYLLLARKKLKLIRQAFPKVKWFMEIEEEWKDSKGETHHVIIDVSTGKAEEFLL